MSNDAKHHTSPSQLQRSAESAGLDSRNLRSLVSGASALLSDAANDGGKAYPPIKWSGFASTDGTPPPIASRGREEHFRILRETNRTLWHSIRAESDIRQPTEMPDVRRNTDRAGTPPNAEDSKSDAYARGIVPALRRAGTVRTTCGTFVPEELLCGLLGRRRRDRADGEEDGGGEDGTAGKRLRSESVLSASGSAAAEQTVGKGEGAGDGQNPDTLEAGAAFTEEIDYHEEEEEYEAEDYVTNHYESEGDNDPDSDGEPTY